MADKCPSCFFDIPSGTLSCPNCHRLTHAARLEELARQAQAAEPADPGEARRFWQEALSLLPPDSKQAESIRARITELSAKLRLAEAEPRQRPEWTKRLGPFAAIGAFAWKFKTLVLLAITKGKFLLLGLTKLNTLFSMLATMGLYWSWFGWRFAVGFVLGIYVHEMGHIWALRNLGLRASAPMFIPGFGAFVSLYDSPANVVEDARIGLAGPIWGSAAALVFTAISFVAEPGLWLALARATATINLFNLIPVWQLDGGRGFRALAFPQRLAIGGLALGMWIATGEVFFALMLLGAAYRTFWLKDHAQEGDPRTSIEFAALVVLFGLMMSLIPVRQ